MSRRKLGLVLVALLFSFGPAPMDQAVAREVSRTEIRSMPITQRPSRPGHFYGNTVRRVNSRRAVR